MKLGWLPKFTENGQFRSIRSPPGRQCLGVPAGSGGLFVDHWTFIGA